MKFSLNLGRCSFLRYQIPSLKRKAIMEKRRKKILSCLPSARRHDPLSSLTSRHHFFAYFIDGWRSLWHWKTGSWLGKRASCGTRRCSRDKRKVLANGRVFGRVEELKSLFLEVAYNKAGMRTCLTPQRIAGTKMTWRWHVNSIIDPNCRNWPKMTENGSKMIHNLPKWTQLPKILKSNRKRPKVINNRQSGPKIAILVSGACCHPSIFFCKYLHIPTKSCN